MKKILMLIITVFILASCGNTENNKVNKVEPETKTSIQKIKVVSSIVPLASIASYVGWDYVESKSLVPVWVSPHWFDLKPSQMIDIKNSDLIVTVGLDQIDSFFNKTIAWKNVIKATDWVKLITWFVDDDEDEWKEENKAEAWIDPHLWNSSKNAINLAEKIKDKLSEISPENKAYFEKNVENFKSELELAKKDFAKNTLNKKEKDFIIFHNAYSYLFQDLNINTNKEHVFRENVLASTDSSSVKELIDTIKEKQIKIAFKEPQLDASNLKKIAWENNIEIYVLDPIWEDIYKNGYINNYKNNLKSLEKTYE